MSSFRKPSPARSVGNETTKKPLPPRRSRSVNSPTPSNASLRLSKVIQEYNERNGGSFVLSPLRRKSVLTDNTNIEEPRRQSWWQMLDDNSREFMDIMDNQQQELVTNAPQNIMEDLDIEILSQEKRNFTLDLPESSDNESINSIVLPQRKLFTEKQHIPQQKFGMIKNNRATLAKVNKTTTKDITLPPPKKLFLNVSSKPVFPEALLASPNKTAIDSPQMMPEPKPKVRNLFGHNQGVKRKNMLANFNFIIESENEADISDIQPKVFGFQKKSDSKPALRKRSSVSSNTTDMELDDWRQLPSSTMVDNQLEAMIDGKTPNKERLSKLSEDKESDTASSDATINKTKLSNKSATKNKSIIKDKENYLSKSVNRSHAKNKDDNDQQIDEGILNEMEVDDEQNNLQIESEQENDSPQEEVQKSDKHLVKMNQSKDKEQVNIQHENDNQHVEIEHEINDQEANRKQEDANMEVENEQQNVNEQESEVENDNHKTESEEENVLNGGQELENDERNEESEQENEDQEIENDGFEVENDELEVENDEQNEESEQDDDQEIENNESEVENNEQNEESEQDNGDQEIEHCDQEVENIEQEIESEQENTEQDIEEENENEHMKSDHEDHDQQVESELENDNEQVESEHENDNEQVESGHENDNEQLESEQENVHEQVESEQENDNEQVESEQENDNEHVESEQEIDDQGEVSKQKSNDQQIETEQENDDNGEESEQENEQEVEIAQETVEQEDESEQEAENEEVESEQETDDHQMETEEAENDQESDDKEITDEIDATPDVSHDTTGRNRDKLRMPEGVLDFVPNNLDTSIERQNAASRMSKNLNVSAPAIGNLQNESMRSSFGARNSSAEGSGWDSHRTTRKTLRQTFGKDFTMRKSLRTMVMEKSAKRQTLHNKGDITSKFPQANSTEIHDETDQYSEADCSGTPPRMPIEMYLEQLMQRKMDMRMKIKEQVRNSLLKVPARDPDNLFKVPKKPVFPRKGIAKAAKSQSKPINSLIPLETLPEEFIQDMKYKPPKRFQPNDASWITKRLYKHLETKLEAKYNYKNRVHAERLVESIYKFTKALKRRDTAAPDAVDQLKQELAQKDIVRTHFDFYEFFYEFLPREVIIKVVPDVVNRIPVPHGVFDNIIK